MSFRITSKGNHNSVLNLMKCSLNCLLVVYLVCNIMVATITAMPELGPIDTALNHQLQSESDTSLVNKRAAPSRQYNFGIGKKAHYNTDLMDDNSDDLLDDNYSSDYAKRGAEQNSRFAFGLGKRARANERFSFGLGKRATQRDNRFAFGLGKREGNGFDEYIKRRYSFGLGKRSPSLESLHYRR